MVLSKAIHKGFTFQSIDTGERNVANLQLIKLKYLNLSPQNITTITINIFTK